MKATLPKQTVAELEARLATERNDARLKCVGDRHTGATSEYLRETKPALLETHHALRTAKELALDADKAEVQATIERTEKEVIPKTRAEIETVAGRVTRLDAELQQALGHMRVLRDQESQLTASIGEGERRIAKIERQKYTLAVEQDPSLEQDIATSIFSQLRRQSAPGEATWGWANVRLVGDPQLGAQLENLEARFPGGHSAIMAQLSRLTGSRLDGHGDDVFTVDSRIDLNKGPGRADRHTFAQIGAQSAPPLTPPGTEGLGLNKVL